MFHNIPCIQTQTRRITHAELNTSCLTVYLVAMGSMINLPHLAGNQLENLLYMLTESYLHFQDRKTGKNSVEIWLGNCT